MDQEIDLNWKAFPNHLVHMFRDLGEKGHFSDVTLVSDDEIQTPAHKVVLSACSPVLKALLVENPHPHPLLFLQGVKQTELQALLKFMYHGKVQLHADRVDEFISVSKDLRVKQIFDEDDSKEEHSLENKNEFVASKDANESKEIDNVEILLIQENSIKVSETTFDSAKTDVERKMNIKAVFPNDSILPDNQEEEKKFANVKQSKYICETADKAFSCKSCNASFKRDESLLRHMRSKHNKVKLTCDQCGSMVFRLKEHIAYAHGTGSQMISCGVCGKSVHKSQLKSHTENHQGVRYPCNNCDYKATTRGSLKKHCMRSHDGIKYFCDKCDHISNSQSYLRRHQRTEHENFRFFCGQCDFKTKRPQYLREHKQRKHTSVTHFGEDDKLLAITNATG